MHQSAQCLLSKATIRRPVKAAWSLDYRQTIEEGMTLALECREGETGVGGARQENMLVVTKNGAEIMDYFSREKVLVAPR